MLIIQIALGYVLGNIIVGLITNERRAIFLSGVFTSLIFFAIAIKFAEPALNPAFVEFIKTLLR
jgi:hypothetical protein